MGLRERQMRKKRPNEVLRRKQFGDEDVVAVVEEICRGQGMAEWSRDMGGEPDLHCLDRRGCVAVVGSD